MKRIAMFTLLALAIAGPARGQLGPDRQDRECTVLLGGALIEREQRYGYWEAVLTGNQPEKTNRFRNLGWSGDTVWGEARAGFDSPREGFKRLVDQTLKLKPRAILIAYGQNEAFAGKAGLPRFKEGFSTLLEALGPIQADITLFAPFRQENLGRPLPDPEAYNRDVQLYSETIRDLARGRGLSRVDLMQGLPQGKPNERLTENGLHFTEYGYWYTSLLWRRSLAAEQRRPILTLPAVGQKERATLPVLPVPRPPRESGAARELYIECVPVVTSHGLPPGEYVLHVDGKPVLTADAAAWAKGVPLLHGPDFEQVEMLRLAIVEKNRQFFHRWRPQNETYLFGFRKHEQGINAKEVAEFDALVAKAEREIALLRKPVARTYELLKK